MGTTVASLKGCAEAVVGWRQDDAVTSAAGVVAAAAAAAAAACTRKRFFFGDQLSQLNASKEESSCQRAC